MITTLNDSLIVCKQKLSTILLASFLLGSGTAVAAPMVISAQSNPTSTGNNAVGAVGLWTNVGTIGGESIDLRGTVTAYNAAQLNFETVGDDPSILLYSSGNGIGAEVKIHWEVFKSGTNQTVFAYGNPTFSVADIDGINGQPYTRETVVPSLDGLTGYRTETVSNLQIEVDAGLVKVSGTQNQNSETTSMVSFSWNNIASWDITYRLDANSVTYAARSVHDGDGDFQFVNPKSTEFLLLDLDADNTTTTGKNYLGTFIAGGTAVVIADNDTLVTQHAALGTDLASATVELTNAQTGDALNVGTLPAGITASIDTSVSGKISVTLSGTASVEDYETALKAVTFVNTEVNPSVVDRHLEVSVHNGVTGTNSEVAISTITVDVDLDHDGVADKVDLDDDNDGILDTVEGTSDSDLDTIPNYLDLDSDNDGIPDNVEAQSTANYVAPSETDVNKDGLDDAYAGGLTPVNKDGADEVDYLDTDSDNDGKLDTIEAGYTVATTTTDTDKDGILDAYDDVSGTDVNDELNSGASTLPDEDKISDDDNEPDYRDVDTDIQAPTVVNDTKIGLSQTAVTVDVLANDSDAESDMDATTVQIVGTANVGDSLVVPNEGTWSINPTTGAITFTPLAGFTNDPTVIKYTVQDRTGLTSTEATVTVDYPQTAPVAVADSATGVSAEPTMVDVLANDTDAENDIDPTTVKIVGTANAGESLVVPNEGTWSINPTTGAITFTPLAGFTNDPTAISYTVTDKTGMVSNAVAVTVDYPQTAPVAVADLATGVFAQSTTVAVLENDTDAENDIDPTKVQIVGTANVGDSLVVPNEGTWSVHATTGAITFTPEVGFTNDPADISYTVKDRTGQVSNAVAVSVDYPQTAPVAVADSVTGVSAEPTMVDVLANDTDAENDIDPTTVKIVGTANAGESLVVPNEGTWSVHATTGTITFTPEAGFTADPTVIKYMVKDATDLTSTEATVSVDYPQTAPVAVVDSATGVSGQATIIAVLGNDTDAENDIDPTTVKIVGTSNAGESLVVPNEGTWSIDGTTGAITFSPLATFTGDPADISYTVTDITGQISNAVAVSIDYPQTAPVAVADLATGVSVQPTTVDVVSNDTDAENDIDPTTVRIVGTSNAGESLVVPKEGTWSVNPTTGAITFTPEAGFTNDPTVIKYTVQDRTGLTSTEATVSVDYPQTVPVAVADSAIGVSSQPTTVDILANDSDAENDIDPTKVQIVGTANVGDSLVVPNEGTWSINPTTGAITFTPLAGFTNDPTVIKYTVQDRIGLTSTEATVSVDYPQTAPVAVADSAIGVSSQPTTVDVLSNDTDAENDIDPTKVQIVGTSAVGESLVVPNEGTWSVNPTTGAITFTPEAGFTNDPTDITYTVTDTTGQVSNAVTVSVDYPQTAPVATEDSVMEVTGNPATITVLGNDTDAENDIDASTLQIVGTANAGESLIVPNEGTWSVNAGTIVFTPNAGFMFDPTPITYTVNDTTGLTSNPVAVTVLYDLDNDGVADVNDLDDDNDGITDVIEENGTPNLDTDGDGVVDSKDLDADNDGILDLLESGQNPAVVDTNNDGVLDSTIDADNDGLMDIVDTDNADANSLGNIIPIDTDSDGTRDFQDVDSDNDGISDLVEAGIPATNDTDSDGMIDNPAVNLHGVATVVTPAINPTNTDGDSVPDYRDLDTDNDGILDVVEAGATDTDGNGLVDTPDTLTDTTILPDVDTDGTPDVREPNNDKLPAVLDTDGNGIIDDAMDTDNDGIPDVTDGKDATFATIPLVDTDKDGIADVYDIDDDNDGIPDLVEENGDVARDTDGDGVIDSKDLDADNDGILDLIEAGGVDSDNNGVVDDVTDVDNDGLATVVDVHSSTADLPTTFTEAIATTNLPVVDTDGDTKRDFQDVDSDNDGISDLVEAGIPATNDTDNDGDIDGAVDTNGITTMVTPVAVPLDTDTDTVPDYRDLDSDNDGLTDVTEAGLPDSEGDGLVDTPDTLVDPTTIPETDGVANPLIPSNPNLAAAIDSDTDGIIDDKTDTDKDGLPDVTDGKDATFATTPLEDTDNDGIADVYDIDDDNDGIADLIEEKGDVARDTDGDGVIDSKDLDADNDGILDIIEAGGVDANNDGVVDDATDTDNDGLANVVDRMPTSADLPTSFDAATLVGLLPVTDTDGDSKPDFQDVDSDNDGIADMIEAGVPASNDADNDGMIDNPMVDVHGVPTVVTAIATPTDTDGDNVPNHRDLDTDNDGILDVIEVGGTDADGNGIVDVPNTLTDGSALPDSDGNTIPDVNEPNNENLPVQIDADKDGVIDNATDTDGDGIPDIVDERDAFATAPMTDSDGDKIDDAYDIDDDNDGIPDLVEEDGDVARDTDGDGVIDSLDLDADNDGILDIVEAGGIDSDNDGVVDNATDVDNDGLANVVDENSTTANIPTDLTEAIETTNLPIGDTDGDTKRDFQDVDSDNDGLSDLVESGTPASNDADNDGMIDTPAVDTHGIATVVTPVAVPVDTDEDKRPNYKDLDSDNDGFNDVGEVGGNDSDGNGLIDGNGTLVNGAPLPDADENNISDVLEPNNDKLPAVIDANGDGIIDDNNDTDNDGIPNVSDENITTYATSPAVDTDGDGITDRYDLDDDNDGIPDLIEENGDVLRDTDGDGVIDSKDLDADNDGILDIIEANGIDADNNGRVDDATDSDNDGLANVADINPDSADAPTDRLEALNIAALLISDTDGDAKPDFQDVDSDNDGLSDLVEAGTPAINDADSDGMIDLTADIDNNGIADNVNIDGVATAVIPIATPIDTDGDSTPNYRDLDSDNDGLNDVEEIGGTDSNHDGLIDGKVTLVDNTTLPDSDKDNTSNVNEPNNAKLPAAVDANNDGIIDDASDIDNDGIPDIVDENPNEFATQESLDSDADGIANQFDIDDDNDGIVDVIENGGDENRDTDGDGVADSIDLDADNDGILDIVEAGGVDSDNDGRVDNATDSDNDGLANSVDVNPTTADAPANEEAGRLLTLLPVTDTDKDGKPDFQDVDSDNDGISDMIEAGVPISNDRNNDGRIDGDVNENGIATVVTPVVNPVDSDKDGIADYKELDSDNDGISDVIEAGGVDVNKDGKVDTEGRLIKAATLPDENGNGVPDYQEFHAEFLSDTLSNVELGTTAVIDVLKNDNVTMLDLSTLQITGTKNPGDSLVVEGEGIWSINSDNSISFTPEEGFVHDPTDITYSLEDVNDERRGAATVNVNYLSYVRPDIKRTNLAEPVTVAVLENDNGDLNVSSVEIVLPTGFRELHPDAVLSKPLLFSKIGSELESGTLLVVPDQGTWKVNADGTITYRAQAGIPIVDPTPISYKVFDMKGNELITSALITLKQTVVAGVIVEEECQTSDSVPTLTKVGLGLLALAGSIFGLFLFREEKNKLKG